MNIKLVKLKSGGFSGAEIHRVEEVVKANRKTYKPIKEYPKDPIHKDLENLFLDLREHLASIVGVIDEHTDEKDAMFILHDIEASGIEFDSEGFIIHGSKKVFGNKKVNLSTPKVEEIDSYDKFHDVMEIARLISIETKLYLDGEKKVSDEELVERWISAGRDKNMNMEAFNNLSSEDQRDFCTKFLEDQYGAIVLHNSELVSDDELANVVEVETEFTIGNNDDEVVVPVSDKKSKKDKKQEAHSPEAKEEAF